MQITQSDFTGHQINLRKKDEGWKVFVVIKEGTNDSTQIQVEGSKRLEDALRNLATAIAKYPD